MFLVAGILAGLIAWSVNILLIKKWNGAAVLVLIPILEEILKTSLAIFFTTSILFTHIIFGIIEGFYDLKTNIKGLTPALFAILTHTLFGLITITIYSYFNSLSFGVMIAIICHIIWNSVIVKISNK